MEVICPRCGHQREAGPGIWVMTPRWTEAHPSSVTQAAWHWKSVTPISGFHGNLKKKKNKLSEPITLQYLFPHILLHHWIMSSFENKSCGILAEYLAHVCTLNYRIVPGDIAVLRLMCIFFFRENFYLNTL